MPVGVPGWEVALVADRDGGRPVLGSVHGFSWSTEESVAYEAAVEAINDAVGAYTAVIAAEERKAAPDQAVIAAAQSGRADCARWREGLDPTRSGRGSVQWHEFERPIEPVAWLGEQAAAVIASCT